MFLVVDYRLDNTSGPVTRARKPKAKREIVLEVCHVVIIDDRD